MNAVATASRVYCQLAPPWRRKVWNQQCLCGPGFGKERICWIAVHGSKLESLHRSQVSLEYYLFRVGLGEIVPSSPTPEGGLRLPDGKRENNKR
jgi:hypothetical protein